MRHPLFRIGAPFLKKYPSGLISATGAWSSIRRGRPCRWATSSWMREMARFEPGPG
ncbi:MAG: hypothetical protein ABI919_01945 [Ramlibacter sp.]